MKTCILIITLFVSLASKGQELFVSTEPASNMAAGSIGLRLNSKLFEMNHNYKFSSYRIEPEIMVGVNKRIMIHVAGYGSNMFQNNFKFEGASLYGKYRFFSRDDVHKHFRMAAFAKFSVINNPEVLITTHQHLFPDGNGGFVEHLEELHVQSNEIDLDGNNSGYMAGMVATKLINKLAVSVSAGYARRLNNLHNMTEIFQPVNAVNYTASAGYLLFPKEYTSYKQLNCNIYMEAMGQSFPGKAKSYFDVAPAFQFIINSIARIDVSYRTQVSGNINRMANNSFMLRLEYNLLNVFNK